VPGSILDGTLWRRRNDCKYLALLDPVGEIGSVCFVEGRFAEEDVLYRRTFCIGGRFVEGRFVEGCYVEGRFVGRTFCSEGRFVEGRFVLAPGFTPPSWTSTQLQGFQ
jgi:hypothetical protein